MKGVIYFEFLDVNQTITADVYSQQLQRLHEVLLEKRPNLVNQKDVILLHDNATPHVAKMTQQTIKQFGWEVLAHPPWSPDLAPSDYHLFLSLRNYLRIGMYRARASRSRLVSVSAQPRSRPVSVSVKSRSRSRSVSVSVVSALISKKVNFDHNHPVKKFLRGKSHLAEAEGLMSSILNTECHHFWDRDWTETESTETETDRDRD